MFSVSLPPESLDAASALFGEVLRAPSFFDIEVEKGIVCEEILEDLDDEGRQVDADNLSRALDLPEPPARLHDHGRRDARPQLHRLDVPRAPRAALRREERVLAFAGAVDADRAMELARARFRARSRAGDVMSRRVPPCTRRRSRASSSSTNVSSQTELRVVLRAMGESAPERAAIDMLMRIVDDGMSTRLYHRICDDKGLCYDVSAGYDGYEDDGLLDFAAGVQHARVARVTKEILAMMTELATRRPDGGGAREGEAPPRVGHRVDARLARGRRGVLRGGLLFGRFETIDERRASLERVTAKDVCENRARDRAAGSVERRGGGNARQRRGRAAAGRGEGVARSAVARPGHRLTVVDRDDRGRAPLVLYAAKNSPITPASSFARDQWSACPPSIVTRFRSWMHASRASSSSTW